MRGIQIAVSSIIKRKRRLDENKEIEDLQMNGG
jgi:hypothetical protein